MKSIHKKSLAILSLSTLIGLGACSAEPTNDAAGAVGQTEEELTLIDCQKQVTTCTRSAKSLSDFAKCTTDLQACTAQAALDLAGQGNLLSTCRSKANTCLKGAVTVSDISACRDIFSACSKDIVDTTTDVFGNAIKTATDAIGKAGQVATDIIGSAPGDVSKALDVLGTCETKANACLSAVVKTSDIAPCEQAFDGCVNGAISIVDTIVDPLPGPTPSQLIDGLSGCQTQSTACLKGAVTVSDVSACRSVLQTCVKNASSIVDGLVSGVTSILPLPVKVPSVGQTVDCTGNLAECLLKLQNPVDCATQATSCATK